MNTILFDPAMDVSQYSVNCSGVSELKAKVFGRRRNDESAAIKITEPKYCSRVLQGNWFEERAECSPILSDNSTTPLKKNVTSPAKKNMNENFMIAKMIKDKGRGMTRDLLVNPERAEFQNNFSTVYDLTYRFLPQGLDGPRLRSYNSRINKWIPEQDLTKNFGNITGYGMTEYIKGLLEFTYDENEKPLTHYQCDYTEKKIPMDIKRFHRKRVDLNIPDLRHLNIDLNTYWSRYLGLGFQRKDLYQKLICGRYSV